MPLGHHLGVPAVMVFLVLSGYVVSALLENNPPLGAFYKERCWRILPMYFACVAIAAFVWSLTPPRLFWPSDPSPTQWISNLLIIPLNFSTHYTPPPLVLLPPAWSLAMEMQFYILAPFLIPRRCIRIGFTALSLSCFAWSQLVIPHPDPWGYRYLPAVLWTFLAGAAIHRKQRYEFFIILTVTCLIFVSVIKLSRQNMPFTIETTLGGIAGILLVIGLSAIQRRKWDDWLGRLAYPVFLIHFPVWYGLGALGVLDHQTAHPRSVYILANILVAIALHHVIEKRINDARRR